MVDDMRNRFEAQLEQLNVTLLEMGSLCEQVINETYIALMDEDREAAREIIEKDMLIDHTERDIETLCMKLLLHQQPVARDLRQVSAALKMITDMERIGDQASDIAEIVMTANLPAPPQNIPIGEMAKASKKMVTQSIDAYVKKDLKIAQLVREADDTVDQLFLVIKDRLLEMLKQDAKAGEYAMDLLMIAKYFERIGDHATNIAEWVEFSITGTHKGDK